LLLLLLLLLLLCGGRRWGRWGSQHYAGKVHESNHHCQPARLQGGSKPQQMRHK